MLSHSKYFISFLHLNVCFNISMEIQLNKSYGNEHKFKALRKHHMSRLNFGNMQFLLKILLMNIILLNVFIYLFYLEK